MSETTRKPWSTHWLTFINEPPIRWWRKTVIWRVEGWLLAWTEGVEPCSDYSARLLAEDDNGDWLVPAGIRDGEPWWQGYWRWWRPDHWPVYLRSRHRRAYVMVEPR